MMLPSGIPQRQYVISPDEPVGQGLPSAGVADDSPTLFVVLVTVPCPSVVTDTDEVVTAVTTVPSEDYWQNWLRPVYWRRGR